MLSNILTILVDTTSQNSATSKDYFLVGLLIGWVIFWVSKDKKKEDD